MALKRFIRGLIELGKDDFYSAGRNFVDAYGKIRSQPVSHNQAPYLNLTLFPSGA
jgi:hypothetical protein